jgi:diguanylate cyclase (GGDEF)-like protein
MNRAPESRITTALAFFESRPRWLLALVVFASIATIMAADLADPTEVEIASLYLFPIFVATWGLGPVPGFVAALACSAAWLGVDIVQHAYVSRTHEAWNALLQLGSFLAFFGVLIALKTALEHERQLALTDPLTGAANRRAFEARAELEIARCARTRAPLTVVLLDVDHFKEVNDRSGHVAGDRLLCEIVRAATGELRGTDLVARLGGDEFAILLAETSYEEARGALRKLNAILGDRMRAGGWEVTFSVGAVTVVAPPASVSALLAEADELLYRVKDGGRNRTLHALRPGSSIPD